MRIFVRGTGRPKDPVFSYNHGLFKFDKESRFVSQYYAIHQRRTIATACVSVRWEGGKGHILPERSPKSQRHRLPDVGIR
jgi:hypothetical protein